MTNVANNNGPAWEFGWFPTNSTPVDPSTFQRYNYTSNYINYYLNVWYGILGDYPNVVYNPSGSAFEQGICVNFFKVAQPANWRLI